MSLNRKPSPGTRRLYSLKAHVKIILVAALLLCILTQALIQSAFGFLFFAPGESFFKQKKRSSLRRLVSKLTDPFICMSPQFFSNSISQIGQNDTAVMPEIPNLRLCVPVGHVAPSQLPRHDFWDEPDLKARRLAGDVKAEWCPSIFARSSPAWPTLFH